MAVKTTPMAAPLSQPAEPADELDQKDGDEGRTGGTQQHGQAARAAAQEEAKDDAGEDHVAQCVAHQALAAQHEEVAEKATASAASVPRRAAAGRSAGTRPR
jgi:hypothetical protein